MKLFNPPYLLLFLLFGSLMTAQEQAPSEVFDDLVALENTDLASGTEYIELHIIRNNQHKYFQTDRFVTGKVVYDGQTYLDIPLKYNIYDDLLLMNLINSGGESTIELHKELVEGFSLQGHSFINLPPSEEDEDTGGFYEVLLENASGLLLKKHVKKILKHLDRNFTYYEFETDEPEYLVFKDNTYFPFDSSRDLFKVFPEQEKLIRKYYRSNRSLSRSNHDQFLIRLFRSLQDPTQH